VAVSIEGPQLAAETQRQFPHLIILADPGRSLAGAADVIHPHSGPGGIDSAAPTTILVDTQGVVRWLFRPENAVRRLSPDEVLAAMDEHLR
jgi:peroxiredoxin